MRHFSTKLIVLATVVCAVTLGAIYSGALTFLASDADVSTNALWSIVTYWALFTLAVLLVTGFVKRPREMSLALVTTLLFLCAAEVALRVLGVEGAKRPYSGLSSSQYHHVNAPNTEMLLGHYDGHAVVIRDNEDGLRCDLSRDEFLEYPERILVMGDSFVWGMGVRQEKMLTEVMQDSLRARYGRDDVAVLAGAAISYSPLLFQRLYREVFSKYRPAVVFLVLDTSDVGDDIFYGTENVGTDSVPRFDLPDEKPNPHYLAVHQLARPLLERIGFNLMYPYYTFFRPNISRYDYYDFQLEIGGVVERNRFFIYRHPLSETRPYFDKTLSYINRIANDVRRDGARFVLVVPPRYSQWSDRECPGNWEIRQYQYTKDDPYELEFIRYFREAAPHLDYPVLDLLPAFQETDRFPLVFHDDPHWNDNGHDFVAGLLDDYLVERGWLK